MTQDDKYPVLRIDNLSYIYRGHWLVDRFRALKDVSFAVFKGEAFGFIGHNGAGKTTTIKSILGLLKPASGEIRIFGKPNTDYKQRRFIGYLPEQPYFYEHLSVRELVEFYARLSGLEGGRRDINSAVERSLEMVSMTDRADARLVALSKGLVQRVAMAQAIVGRPKLLVLDEPFSGLDPIWRKNMRDLILSLKEDGTTVFMSSHILSDVEFICDRVAVMKEGELRGIYSMRTGSELNVGSYELTLEGDDTDIEHIKELSDEVKYIKGKKSVKLSFTDREKAEEALRRAVASKAAVSSYGFMSGNLEDLFIKIVKSTGDRESRGSV